MDIKPGRLDKTAGSTSTKGVRDPQSRHPGVGSEVESLADALLTQDFYDRLRQYTLRFGADAADILGDTLLRLCDPETAGRFSHSKGKPLQFAIGVARHVAKEYWRRARRDRKFVALNDSIVDPRSALTDRTSELDNRERVERLLADLRAEDRGLLIRWSILGSTVMTTLERRRLEAVKQKLRRRFRTN